MQVILPDGRFSHFVKRSAAYQLVRDRCADWEGDAHERIYKLPETLAAEQRGYKAGFSDVWITKPSGYAGPLVMQLQT